jgi:GNAT superfamily N-acetyltransferase
VTELGAGGIRVRRANREDWPRMVELYRELAAFERLPPPTDEEAAALGAMIFDAGRLEALVAEPGGRIEGMAVFWMSIGSSFRARPMLFLEDLAVSSAARSRGVGAALMAELARIGVARRALRMEWAVLDWNVDAMRFYRRLGAGPRNDWVQFTLDEDGIKRLAEDG